MVLRVRYRWIMALRVIYRIDMVSRDTGELWYPG